MSRVLFFSSILCAAPFASAQLDLPLLGELIKIDDVLDVGSLGAPLGGMLNVEGLLQGSNRSSAVITLDPFKNLIENDPLNIGGGVADILTQSAPVAGPLLLNVAPLVDLGIVLPLLPDLPF